uniref:Uncharacterized protein n=1 Tax=Fagus sylvatica TaxID=28930 RepID=A0A2N9G7E1_FAGSY
MAMVGFCLGFNGSGFRFQGLGFSGHGGFMFDSTAAVDLALGFDGGGGFGFGYPLLPIASQGSSIADTHNLDSTIQNFRSPWLGLRTSFETYFTTPLETNSLSLTLKATIMKKSI